MNYLRTLAAIVIALLIQVSAGFSATVIRFGKLVDGSGKVLTNAIVVVDGQRIKSVGTAESAIPPNSEIIDLSRYTGIPGLMDMHTHMAGNAGCPSCAPPNRTAVELWYLATQRA